MDDAFVAVSDVPIVLTVAIAWEVVLAMPDEEVGQGVLLYSMVALLLDRLLYDVP